MLSVAEEGALVGVRMEALRRAGGRVLVRIQDLLVLDGLSVFWAAIVGRRVRFDVTFL